MPILVAEAIAYVATAAGVAGVVATTGWVVVASYAITVAASYAYSSYQARQARNAAKDQFNQSLKDRLVMVATTDNPRSRLYGRVRNVDGVLFKNTHGSLSQYYTFVVAIAGHEVDAFEDFWFSDRRLVLDGSGFVQSAPYNVLSTTSGFENFTPSAGSGTFALAHSPIVGSVSVYVPGATSQDAPTFVPSSISGSNVNYTGAVPGALTYVTYQYGAGTSYARVRAYTGAPGQDLSTDLIALGVPDITSAHKFEGIACLLITLQFNTDAFPQGIPGFSATVRGAKIFDPRTGLTVWTENPALIARDWATYSGGGNASTNEIVDSTVIAAANACDVSTVFNFPPFLVTKPMYTCGIVAPTQTDPTQTLNEIVASMAGKFAWVGGQLRFKAGAYTASVASVDESWLSGQGTIEIVSGIPRIDLVNVYRPSIADIDKGFVVAPTQPVVAAAYVALDGEQLPRDVTFLGITDFIHAQHVSGVLLRDARQALTIKLPCNMKGYPLDVFDTISLTLSQYGWTNKEFEILTWEFAEQAGVILTMKETAAGIFDPAASFSASDIAPNTALPLPWIVPTPTGLAVTSGTVILDDGTVGTRTLVTWDPTTSESVRQSGTIEVQCASMFDGVWQSVYTEGRDTRVVIPSLFGNTTYVFRVRAISSSPLNVKSDWSAQVGYVVAHPANAITDWTDIPGRPLIYRAISQGLDDTSAPLAAALYDESGALISGAGRSYIVNVFDRATGLPISIGTNLFDVHGSPAAATAMAAALNALGTNRIVCVRTYDEPQVNRLLNGLDLAMYRCGASPAVFGKPTFANRAAYVLVGIAGCGQGNGFESYSDYSVPTRDFCDVSFMIKGGNLIVTGSGATPGSLTDYGYTGTLDATTDLLLLARGQCVVAGNFISKLGGSASWDSDVYSRDSAFAACFASAVPVQANANIMFGLNSDPTTDQTYTGLDYALYLETTGNLYAYESGVGTLIGTYAVNDVLVVLYDGSRVRYMKNGLVLRTVSVAANLTLFFDSSFFTPNCSLKGVRFGVLSANDWNSIGGVSVTTGQIAPAAATEVYVTAPGAQVTVTQLAFTPDNYVRNTILRSITFTPSNSGFAQAFFDGRGIYTNSLGFVADAIWSIQDASAGAVYDGWKKLDVGIPASGTNISFSMATTRSFAVVGGQAYTIGVYAHKLNAGDTFVVDNLEFRIEVIKR